MTTTNDIIRTTTPERARESVDKVLSRLGEVAGEIVWQIKNQAWLALGYASWDEMREAEYGGAAVIVPRADRPELVAKLRQEGMTQQDIANTIGAGLATVNRDLNFQMENETRLANVVNSRGQERPSSYAPRQPKPEPAPPVEDGYRVVAGPPESPVHINYETGEVIDLPTVEPSNDASALRRRPLAESLRDAALDLDKIIRRWERLVSDDRFSRNKDEVARYQNDLIRAVEALQRCSDKFNR